MRNDSVYKNEENHRETKLMEQDIENRNAIKHKIRVILKCYKNN